MSLPTYFTATKLSEELAEKHGIDLPSGRIEELARLGYLPHSTCDGRGPLFRADKIKAYIRRQIIKDKEARPFPTKFSIIDFTNLKVHADVPAELAPVAGLLNEFPMSLLQPISCVYFLVREGRVVYVGKTNYIAARATTHRMKSGRKVFDRAIYLNVPADQAFDIERTFIHILKPEYNGTAPLADASEADHEFLRERFAPASANGEA